MRRNECTAGSVDRLPFQKGGEEKARMLLKSVCPPKLIISYSNVDKMSALIDLVDTLLLKRVNEPIPLNKGCLHNIVLLRNQMERCG